MLLFNWVILAGFYACVYVCVFLVSVFACWCYVCLFLVSYYLPFLGMCYVIFYDVMYACKYLVIMSSFLVLMM